MNIKHIVALGIIASLTLAAPAYAQQTTNSKSGEVVDGYGQGIITPQKAIVSGSERHRRDGTCYVISSSGRVVDVICPTPTR